MKRADPAPPQEPFQQVAGGLGVLGDLGVLGPTTIFLCKIPKNLIRQVPNSRKNPLFLCNIPNPPSSRSIEGTGVPSRSLSASRSLAAWGVGR